MNLIGNSVRRPVLTTVIMTILVLLGFYSFHQLGMALLPKMDIPVVLVRVPYKGAGPLEIERLIVQPVEDAIASVRVSRRSTDTPSRHGFRRSVLEYEVDVTRRPSTSRPG